MEDNRTKIYELIFGKFKFAGMKSLLGSSMLKVIDVVVEQDTNALETRYLQQPAKIKLPYEEVIDHAKKLYSEW